MEEKFLTTQIDEYAEDLQFYGYTRNADNSWENSFRQAQVLIGTMEECATIKFTFGNMQGVMLFDSKDIPQVAREMSEALLFAWQDDILPGENGSARVSEHVLTKIGLHEANHIAFGLMLPENRMTLKNTMDNMEKFDDKDELVETVATLTMSVWMLHAGGRKAALFIKPDEEKLPDDSSMYGENWPHEDVYTLSTEEIAFIRQMLFGANRQ